MHRLGTTRWGFRFPSVIHSIILIGFLYRVRIIYNYFLFTFLCHQRASYPRAERVCVPSLEAHAGRVEDETLSWLCPLVPGQYLKARALGVSEFYMVLQRATLTTALWP